MTKIFRGVVKRILIEKLKFAILTNDEYQKEYALRMLRTKVHLPQSEVDAIIEYVTSEIANGKATKGDADGAKF